MTATPKFDPAAWQPEINMTQFILDNGLTVLVLPDHRLPIVSLQIHYKVGSRHESPGITGISHLFEHLMFRGTETLGPEEFSRILQAKGGEINAFTTRDHTSYFENLPAEHLELGLKLEADRLLNLKLNEETFAPERQVVISERKLRSVDSPFGLVEEQLFATAYTQHPYNWPVIGWDQDLQRLTLNDCLAYYRDHYHPGRMTVVVAGDVAPEAARELVQKYFGGIPPGRAPGRDQKGLPGGGDVRRVPHRGSGPPGSLPPYLAVHYPVRRQSLPVLPGVRAPWESRGTERGAGPPALLLPGPGPYGGGGRGRAGEPHCPAGAGNLGRAGAAPERRGGPGGTGPGP
jgi:zinc protease